MGRLWISLFAWVFAAGDTCQGGLAAWGHRAAGSGWSSPDRGIQLYRSEFGRQSALRTTGWCEETPTCLRGGGTLKFGMNQAEKLGVQRVKRALNKELREIAWSNPELQSDDRLLRFLRSYGHDEQKTVTKMREMLKWRRIHGADKIRAEVRRCWTEDFWSMPCLQRRDFYREMYLFEPNHKELSNGDLASVEYTGRIHIRDFMHGISEHEIMTFWTYLMEWNMIKLAELSKKHNRIARMVQLKDLHGLSLWQATCPKGMSIFRKINIMLHLVYPETLSQLVLMNLPGVFGMIWSIFRPLLPSRTLGKIGILSGEAETKRGLAELLGADDDLAIAGSAEILFNVPPQRQKIGRIINKGMRLLACAILVGVTLRPAVKPSAQGKGMKAVNQSILR